MTLGILGRSRRRDLGYFAPAATAPRFDLGPEFSPEQYESRQQFERGAQAFLDYARRPPDAGAPPTQDPRLQRYQESVQWLTLRDPARASELAHQAAQIGIMAQRRAWRPSQFGYRHRFSGPPAPAGIGFIQVPVMPPGSPWFAAWAGTPVWL